MSQPLLIVLPSPILSVTASRGAGAERMLTDDPREAWFDTEATSAVTIDLTLNYQEIDTVYLGYNNAYLSPDCRWTISSGVSSPTETIWAQDALLCAPYTVIGRPRQSFFRRADVVTARYLRIVAQQPGAGYEPLSAGIIRVGHAFQPEWNHEYGSGRAPIDTGVRERVGGGFGFSPGVVKGSWSWTMGDLSDDELARLWGIALQCGQTGSLLVVEDPDFTNGLGERIHWGVFDKLEAYERRAVSLNRWAFTIEDWM